MKIKINKFNKWSLSKKGLLIIIAILLTLCVPIQFIKNNVSADDYDDRIAAIALEVERFQAEGARLRSEADTLQSALAQLINQKNALQAEIDLNQAKYDQLVIKIAETEKLIEDNKDALGKTIADLYVDDKISPIEMIASSRNISEYIDKQEYRNSIRDELTSTIAKVKELKKSLDSQRVESDRVLTDQKTQRDELVNKENEHQTLLANTQGQEAEYQRLSTDKNAEISRLRAQQAAELAARARSKGGGYTSSQGDGSRGGYPLKWLDAPLDSYVDDWGMYSRECVSYAAFKVDQAYGNMPYWGGRGNANQWAGNARASGIPTSTVPAAGTVAVVSNGTYGHAAWVEAVNADGTINISHFNINWNGDYAEWYNLSPSLFDTYIYFGDWH